MNEVYIELADKIYDCVCEITKCVIVVYLLKQIKEGLIIAAKKR